METKQDVPGQVIGCKRCVGVIIHKDQVGYAPGSRTPSGASGKNTAARDGCCRPPCSPRPSCSSAGVPVPYFAQQVSRLHLFPHRVRKPSAPRHTGMPAHQRSTSAIRFHYSCWNAAGASPAPLPASKSHHASNGWHAPHCIRSADTGAGGYHRKPDFARLSYWSASCSATWIW
jgi:hypothetical protein